MILLPSDGWPPASAVPPAVSSAAPARAHDRRAHGTAGRACRRHFDGECLGTEHREAAVAHRCLRQPHRRFRYPSRSSRCSRAACRVGTALPRWTSVFFLMSGAWAWRIPSGAVAKSFRHLPAVSSRPKGIRRSPRHSTVVALGIRPSACSGEKVDARALSGAASQRTQCHRWAVLAHE